MGNDESLGINAPTLPKAGGAIRSIGDGLGPVGASGAASLELPLPISAGRGFAPHLSLRYSSTVGNSPFGIGWTTQTNAITRRTTKGVPGYDDEDVMVGPEGDVWMPERDPGGAPIARPVTHYQGQPVGSYSVVRYWSDTAGSSTLIERWFDAADPVGFWLIHAADGTLHLYGRTVASRRADPDAAERVGVWLLDESLNARGEHIAYEYKVDDQAPGPNQPHDYRAQRYLSKVYYGNVEASDQLYAWHTVGWSAMEWHFHLVFDYGERSDAIEAVPTYEEAAPWSERCDAFSSYAYGFELSTRRLCRQVLMFHHFAQEPDMGSAPVLVRRLLLEYCSTSLGYNLLNAAHSQAFDAAQKAQGRPPLELSYTPFEPIITPQHFRPFDAMPGLNEGERYQLVDLYGEGLPGILYRDDKAWYYRQPQRAEPGARDDQVAYGDWQALQRVPVADASKPVQQFLSDLTGDGRLEWIVAQPGWCGFFTCNPDRSWSNFATLAALPQEFFHPRTQLADLMGAGLPDLVMIGPRSVRLYANRREAGFAPAQEIPRNADDDALPLLSNASTELVAFSDVLGSGQQHLIRIRHNEVRCWPNLGRGRFGKGFVFSPLPFAYDTFDVSHILLTDLDGSGAMDLIYLTPECALIYMNNCGNGLAREPIRLPWPPGVVHDRFCQVSTADLQGLGCSSLVLTVPHMTPRHWRYDFVAAKPYLLRATNNNMGAAATIGYRSSAQEWLDEKQQLLANDKIPVSYLPFPMPVVSVQTQYDEITANQLTQQFTYRNAYYDGQEREFRGFGLLLATDCEALVEGPVSAGYTAPVLRKTWFHVGRELDPPTVDWFNGDSGARCMGGHLLSHYHEQDKTDQISAPTLHELPNVLRALAGQVLRVETFAAHDALGVPYSVEQHRYLLRRLERPVGGAFAPYLVLETLVLESIAYHYEREAADPLCRHTINLRWDEFAHLIHSVSVSYARRLRASDEPACQMDVGQVAPEKRWWCDAHDSTQQSYYLNESLARFIHLNDPQGWRLGLPYLQRDNALVLKKGAGPEGLTPEAIGYEEFTRQVPQNPLNAQAQRELLGQSVQRYLDTQSASWLEILPDGEATFPALSGFEEIAELGRTALTAYDALKNERGEMPFDLEQKLIEVGYHKMPWVLSLRPEEAQDPLWSVKRDFNTYLPLAFFYSVLAVQPTRSHGLTHLSYDDYNCLNTGVRLPDGCETRVNAVDYRLLLPTRIIDPNGNVQEVLHGAFGQLLATGFYGSERGQPIGFDPLISYSRPANDSPGSAIADPDTALLNAATAGFEDAYSWMGKVLGSDRQDRAWMNECVVQGDLLPDGHIRASARVLAGKAMTPARQRLLALIPLVHREPVHAVTLQADRYPGEANKQIRITIACWDGFGRSLQSKQRVDPGDAYQIEEDGSLALDGEGNPVIVHSVARWRVSERVEYNNKGQPVRIYRPYFADQYRYINDVSFRQFGYCDQQFYDPLGRPTRTVLAREGYLRRHTYFPWYSMYEDENDTFDEVMATRGAGT